MSDISKSLVDSIILKFLYSVVLFANRQTKLKCLFLNIEIKFLVSKVRGLVKHSVMRVLHKSKFTYHVPKLANFF